MTNIVKVEYKQTGESTNINAMGMRDMQARAYEDRDAQYLLLKAPPASGKSRALMFLALDKLHKQGLKKVVVAVPERAIGASFAATPLSQHGFFADWEPLPEYNLCTAGGDEGKVKAFIRFMKSAEQILICTHATLRFAFEHIDEAAFDKTLLAIDEFHHVSADTVNSRIGSLLNAVMTKSSAHIVAMTGSYFRGDGVPVLAPEVEARFTKVTYNYYEQLNGYTHLKSLGIGYHFYQGKYTSAIDKILDTDKKTILHIPNVNTGESTKDKYQEVDSILDIIGVVERQDERTGILFVKRHDGKQLKIADLVNEERRDRVTEYLRTMTADSDIDLIIALGMAKEGFDWPCCEHALTVGYRGSLTEVVQIIGRCTRDSAGKSHAQFTNLIAAPDADDDRIKISVNNMLKAITCSLLMEQVLAPNLKFKAKGLLDDSGRAAGEIVIHGFKEPSTKRVRDILEMDLNDLKADIFQDDKVIKTLPGGIDPEVINKVLIPKVIQTRYPELSETEVEEVRQHVIADSVIKKGEIKEVGDQRFIRVASQFINIDELSVDLIDKINPFQEAFEIFSKDLTPPLLKLIQDVIDVGRSEMTEGEAIILWPKIRSFHADNNRHPEVNALDPSEQRLALARILLIRLKAKYGG